MVTLNGPNVTRHVRFAWLRKVRGGRASATAQAVAPAAPRCIHVRCKTVDERNRNHNASLSATIVLKSSSVIRSIPVIVWSGVNGSVTSIGMNGEANFLAPGPSLRAFLPQ